MLIKSLLAALLFFAAGVLSALAMLGYGWWTFRSLEPSVTSRMDQYYLAITSPGREEYLLGEDEVFEVPYMASRLSVAAEPTRLYDSSDRLMAEFSVEKGLYAAEVEDLPVFLRKALVAAEDATFYEHRGVNWKAIVRAFTVNLRRMRRAQGGSTITQQLAKMMFTTRRKTYGRKVFELFCARKLESKFTKDQILLMYLNFAYYGHGAFGVESAARYYFDKPARALELGEAVMLVGLVANPRRYSPYENRDLAKARHRTVLSRMAKLGFLPAAEVERYSAQFWKEMARRPGAPEVSFWRTRVNEAPYAVEFLRRALLRRYTKERILKAGLRVHSTFDLDVQKAAQDALRAGLREVNAAGEAGAAPIEGSLVALRPEDGAILALAGGSGFRFDNQLDRAADSRRPVGSAVKPFVYAEAFESGRFAPGDEMTDEPVRLRNPGGRRWEPQNYGNKYHGRVTLDFALRASLNSVAIRVLKAGDIDAVIGALSKASGIARPEFPRNLALALGSVDFSALQLARAYAVFINGGLSVEPYCLLYVEDREGRVIHDERARPAGEAVFSPRTCAAMVEILKGVLREGGTAHAAALRTGFNIPAAGKTGTTNDYRDSWFAGVVPGLSAAVWMGHDDQRLSLGRGGAGGALSAPVWMNFVKAAHQRRPAREFDGAGLKE